MLLALHDLAHSNVQRLNRLHVQRGCSSRGSIWLFAVVSAAAARNVICCCCYFGDLRRESGGEKVLPNIFVQYSTYSILKIAYTGAEPHFGSLN